MNTGGPDERLVFVDLETGGSLPWRPIIQIAAIAVSSSLRELEVFESKIMFQKRFVDPKSLRNRHYSPERWKREARPAGEVASAFAAFLRRHATLEINGGNLEESLGAREVDLRPKLSPVPSAKDVGRRAIRNFGKVDVNQVIPDPDQPRVEFSQEAIERLSQSIRDKGQLSPIRVRWSAELEKWVIISGERRWRATRHAGLPTIDCYFHEGELAKTEILEQQLIENLLREDLSPVEEAKAFRNLMEINQWNGKQVADALRVNASKVSRALPLLDLPADIQQRIDSGEIAARTAYEISKLTSEDAQRQLAEQAALGALSIGDASNAVRKRAGKPKAVPRGTRQVFVTEAGWKVTVTARQKGSYDEIEQALQLALEEVQTRIRSGLQVF